MSKPFNAPPEFAVYVSSVPGKTFIRPGTTQILGGRRVRGGPVEWQPDKIIPIPTVEYGRYLREYNRAIDREGSLKKRTAEEWKAQAEREAKAATEAAEAAKKRLAERAAEAAAETSPDAPDASDTP